METSGMMSSMIKKVLDLSSETVKQRQHDVAWHLRENGVTYNVYKDTDGYNRLWNLDIIPFVICEDEWSTLQKGMEQRGRLMEAILADLYTQRRCLSEGIIPYQVVYGHGGFLRECDGLVTALPFFAVDMVKGADGVFRVYDDRVQAPSGLGYALENRLTIGRVMPELFEGISIERLSYFFETYKKMVIACSPTQRDDAFIVILTPGPWNETYFEHAYLASYLGYPIVRGDDLVVKDRYVWLKTLSGLKKVDVIIRRVDAWYCDPLVLKNDSQLGVAGLVSVIRDGHVKVINPLGSGLLENPGLYPFMDALAQFFLGESLIVPQIPTLWCGEPDNVQKFLANPQSYRLRRIDQPAKQEVNKDFDLLCEELLAQPSMYVIQAWGSMATTQVLGDEGATQRPFSLRLFGIQTPVDHAIMPGGLIRATHNVGEGFSSKIGSVSQDVWILTPQTSAQASPMARKRSVSSSVIMEDLPSLTAENLYWVGRYCARALITVRYIRTLLYVMSEANHYEYATNIMCQRTLQNGLTHLTMTYPGFFDEMTAHDPLKHIMNLLQDDTMIGGLAHTLLMLSKASFGVKSLWSHDTWRVLDRMLLEWKNPVNRMSWRQLIDHLDMMIIRMVAFTGLIHESLVVKQGTTVYTIGLKIEEALLEVSKIRSLLVIAHDADVEYELLEVLLESCEALNAYRYGYKSHLSLENVTSMMIVSEHYPRSLLMLVRTILDLMKSLPQHPKKGILATYERPLFELFSKLSLLSIDDLLQTNDAGIREDLDRLLGLAYTQLSLTSDMISRTYFSHSQYA